MRKFLAFLAVAGFAAFAWKTIKAGSGIFLSPPEIRGGVVRVKNDQGDRLYYLTTQWEKRISQIGSRSSSSSRTFGWVHTDLWALDPATAQPVFRKRLKSDKINGDSAALGVEQGVLWARMPELAGIRLSDGAIVADREKIGARNPAIAGLIPKPAQAGTFLPDSMQPLKFDPAAGMIVRLDDARQVRIDPLTLEATPYLPPKEGAEKKPDRTTMVSISSGMEWRAMVRGLAMERSDGDMDWLGLLAETELEMAKERKTVGNQMNFSEPQRHRFYRARLKTIKEFLGPRLQFLDPVVLPESPEFLMAGLLTQDPASWDQATAMWRRNPDSVFVLSRDRLGDEGRLQLARVAGPAGKPVWNAALPLSNMSAWLPGERHALMLGPAPSAPRSPKAEEGENAAMHILSVDLETGALQSFNPDLHRDWPVEGISQKTP